MKTATNARSAALAVAATPEMADATVLNASTATSARIPPIRHVVRVVNVTPVRKVDVTENYAMVVASAWNAASAYAVKAANLYVYA